MNLPQVVSREEWLAARKELLAKEKEATRARDALNAERRGLPMVEVEKEYVFEGPDGPATLLDLFEGRRQLIVQHFMFDPEWDEGCPSCTYFSDDLGHLPHLHEKDTSFAVVSRAPLEKIESYKRRRGWTFPCSIGNLADMEQCLEEMAAMFAGLGCAVAVTISVQTPEGRAEK